MKNLQENTLPVLAWTVEKETDEANHFHQQTLTKLRLSKHLPFCLCWSAQLLITVEELPLLTEQSL